MSIEKDTGTPEQMTPRDPKIVGHIRALVDSGLETEKFVKALRAIRMDGELSPGQRLAIHKTIAQNAACSFMAIVSSGPLPGGAEESS